MIASAVAVCGGTSPQCTWPWPCQRLEKNLARGGRSRCQKRPHDRGHHARRMIFFKIVLLPKGVGRAMDEGEELYRMEKVPCAMEIFLHSHGDFWFFLHGIFFC